MICCLNKCNNLDCEKNIKNNSQSDGDYSYGWLEGFSLYCPKAEGAPVDNTDAPKIYSKITIGGNW